MIFFLLNYIFITFYFDERLASRSSGKSGILEAWSLNLTSLYSGISWLIVQVYCQSEPGCMGNVHPSF